MATSSKGEGRGWLQAVRAKAGDGGRGKSSVISKSKIIVRNVRREQNNFLRKL